MVSLIELRDDSRKCLFRSLISPPATSNVRQVLLQAFAHVNEQLLAQDVVHASLQLILHVLLQEALQRLLQSLHESLFTTSSATSRIGIPNAASIGSTFLIKALRVSISFQLNFKWIKVINFLNFLFW